MTAHPVPAGRTADTVPPPTMIRNEFSLVELSYVRSGDSLGLVVSDADSGDRVLLRAADLRTLARAPHEAFRRLLRAIDDHHDAPA